MAVQSFASKALERFFFDGAIPKKAGWSDVARAVARKLDILDYAERLGDLASPTGNRLEALKGDMIGYHSIRINDQWRVVFRWTDAGPMDVAVVDYHKG